MRHRKPARTKPLLLTLAALATLARGVSAETATPIKHLVVIFQENVSFDHYFATYPVAVDPPNEPRSPRSPARLPSTASPLPS